MNPPRAKNQLLRPLMSSKSLPISPATKRSTPAPTIKQSPQQPVYSLLELIKADFQIILEKDQAATNGLEVLLFYSGLHALWMYRIAHILYGWKVPLIPRGISQLSRWLTGIEIHPGAQIGKSVFIDHGMGVVIGETAIVGDHALIYQGVTLGGTGKEIGKRHPTLGNHVLVGAGAKILGNITIGDQVWVGAGSIVLRDVPSNCTVVGVPGRVTRNEQQNHISVATDCLPDPEAAVIRNLFERIKHLETQIGQLQTQVSAIEVEPQSSSSEIIRSESDRAVEEFLNGAGI